jgi:Protein of unknown function (DUF3592)
MKNWVGRLMGGIFLGSFCLAGPLLLMLALGAAAERTLLVVSGQRAEATIVAMRTSPSFRGSVAPVVRFTADDGRSYVISSDVFEAESAIRFGQRVRVLYRPAHPEGARVDDIAALWTLPLVTGLTGAGLSVVPAILWVSWLRRRAERLEPARQAAAHAAADAVSRRFRQLLGILLIVAGCVLVARGFGLLPADLSARGSRLMNITLGILLAATGVQVSQLVQPGGRLANSFGSAIVTALAVMFGWVAIYGDNASFSSGIGGGGLAMPSGSGAHAARIAFGAASAITGLVACWAWMRALRVNLRSCSASEA